jgi:starch phosphorylase
MEIGLESAMPTYAGGLGVLAGDTVRAAADLRLPMVAISLVHRHGYFRQQLDSHGVQTESPSQWTPESILEELPPRVRIPLEGMTVCVRAWLYRVRGITGGEVPVYLLDTALSENTPQHQRLTDVLYGGDDRYRLCQEAVLGLGGVAMLEALGHSELIVHHMNEGHSALLALALLERQPAGGSAALQAVRDRCVFTTHTPVPAGHDQFPISLVHAVLGAERAARLDAIGCTSDGTVNMTHLGLHFSHYVNGVAMRHGQISRGMFPGYPIASVTNGVHAATWAAPAFGDLYDRHISDWRIANANLRYAISIPTPEIRAAHLCCQRELFAEIERRTGVKLQEQALTLGFARRVTAYKRSDMLLSDPSRLARIAELGPMQIIYAGKAHPRDGTGREMIRRILARASELAGRVQVLYLEEYDMALAKLLVAGVDLWVNTPQKPQEASGTSGMKAAINGVPSLSVLDGWWIEGHVEGVTGWSIGDNYEAELDPDREAVLLYQKLEEVASAFHRRPDAYSGIMRYAIALNGSFFNAQRMVEQYVQSAYRPRG